MAVDDAEVEDLAPAFREARQSFHHLTKFHGELRKLFRSVFLKLITQCKPFQDKLLRLDIL